jgi:rhodanese-related sulfurtransferase
MKNLLIIMTALAFTFALASPAGAVMVPAPTDPPAGVQLISVSDAKAIVSSGMAQIFDMRKALNFSKGHIPRAVSLPYTWTGTGTPAKRTGEYDMTRLPRNKSIAIIFHSNGPNGWKSYYASKAAAEAGYKNVLWMREGFETWSEKGYPVEN